MKLVFHWDVLRYRDRRQVTRRKRLLQGLDPHQQNLRVQIRAHRLRLLGRYRIEHPAHVCPALDILGLDMDARPVLFCIWPPVFTGKFSCDGLTQVKITDIEGANPTEADEKRPIRLSDLSSISCKT
jgi:hypothetical protein